MNILNFLFNKKRYFRLGISSFDKFIVQKKWNEIIELVKLGGPSRFRSAIIEADKLLNFILEKMGYSGSLGEKLKTAKDKFIEGNDYSIYNDIWQAHKYRNCVVHDIGHEILSHEAYDVINKYKKGFKKLKVL